jgi:cell wall-associated NlpC family hydrolase
MARPRLLSLSTALVVAALGWAESGQAQGAAPKPFEALSRTLLSGKDELSRTILAGHDSLVRVARQQVGLRYQLGAKQPGKAFDCSALVQWIAGLFGREMPRTAAQQATVGVEVPKDTTQLLPGDLLFFGRGKRVTHIGIYVGEGKYVHAANKRKGVIESEIARAKPTYWKGTRRIFYDADSVLGEVTPSLSLLGRPES